MTQLASFENLHQIGEVVDALLAGCRHHAGSDVRREDEIAHGIAGDRSERIVRPQRLIGEAVDSAAVELAVMQRRQQIVFVDDAGRAAMRKIGAALHLREECATDALVVLGQVRQEAGNEVALPCKFIARDVREAKVGLDRLRQRMALRIDHPAAEALQPPRQLGADFAEAQDADRALVEGVDLSPLRPVEGEVVLATALGRKVPVAGLVRDVDQFPQALRQRQHLQDKMLGDKDTGAHRHEADGHASPFRGRRIDVPDLRSETLDQLELFAGGDHIGIDRPSALADKEIHIRQQGNDLVLDRRAAHDDVEDVRRGVERGLLMELAAIGDEQGPLFWHCPQGSMSVEDPLVIDQALPNRAFFRLRRMVRVGGGRKAAEPHQTCHQQHPRLGGGQVASAD